ncbi:MAG: response regulator [Opitutaceae bacterium]|nr:response regulator [Opitutaceae bacterium]
MQELPPILVAEDDDDDFFFLRRAIRTAGIENPILRFRDGAELIKFLEQIPRSEVGPAAGSPWLLLLDITMPMMNGFEVLGWLKSHRRLPRVRPVMLSGSYRPDDIARATALGAIDYLLKPITPAVLAGVMAKGLVPSLQG